MSYCRWSEESDIYLFHHYQGFLECCGCALKGEDLFFHANTRSKMLTHLEAHIEAGHRVPPDAIDRLEEEINDIGDEVE